MPDREELEGEGIARPFWSGTITFGLVSIPVNLLPATRSAGISLRMVSREGTPLRRRYFTSRDDRPLEWDEIVRGYEIEKDRFVVVADEELERLAPERTRDIDLRLFARAELIDPVYFERAYFLTPDGESTKAYRLLAQVMEETGRAGVATFVMRGKEYLVAILAENGILRAETLRFAEEVRSPEDVGLPAPLTPAAGEVTAMQRAIDRLARDRLDLDELRDSSAGRIEKIVTRKLKKKEGVMKVEKKRAEDTDVIDLVEMLQRSLRGPSGGSGTAPSGPAADELSDLSKSDLYDRAKELDIPGRSGMSKDELIEAIRRSA